MHDKTVRARMTSPQRRHHYFLIDLMKELNYDLHHQLQAGLFALPAGWQQIADAPRRGVKERMTLRLDSDVVKFFRGTGQGFQTRMNDVLRCYMHARLSNMVEDGARYRDYIDDEEPKRRPLVGDTEKMWTQAFARTDDE
jgi:uncharacterized protein (DUF4415 family)